MEELKVWFLTELKALPKLCDSIEDILLYDKEFPVERLADVFVGILEAHIDVYKRNYDNSSERS